MMKNEGVFPHNMTACSTFVYEDWIYVITGNGVDDTHKIIPAPKAPSVICFKKKTGKVVWTDNTPGERHPARAVLQPRRSPRPTACRWSSARSATAGFTPTTAETARSSGSSTRNNKETTYPDDAQRADRHAGGRRITCCTSPTARTPSTARARATSGASTSPRPAT